MKTEESIQFDYVENLILCKCGYNSVEMSEISKMFPNVRQLNFSSNLIESLGSSHFVPSNLTFLDLSRNNLISWKSVVNLLRNCSELVELNLTETGLNEFELLEPVLKSLKIMIASKNPIADFRSFSNLNLTGKTDIKLLYRSFCYLFLSVQFNFCYFSSKSNITLNS